MILEATRNYPPMKDDICEILKELKELFPELETLKKLRSKISSGGVSAFWWKMIPIYDLNKRIEAEINKKPFHSKRAREVFAYILWLSHELLFKKDLQKMINKEEAINEYEDTQRQLRTERIILGIIFANEKFKKITGSKDVYIFRQDVPIFFAKLPTKCQGADDFLARIQSLGSIFEVNLEPLRRIVSNADPKFGSIRIVHEWFKEKEIPHYEEIIEVWENIRLLRNAPPTHPRVSPKIFKVLTFFGESLPINFTKLWDSILKEFSESLERIQEIF